MAFQPRRAAGPARRAARLGTSAALATALVGGFAACGFDLQTMEPYTPADGVARDIGSVKVRNLMILTKTAGSGFLSGSMLSTGRGDSLTAVTGVPVQPGGTDGQPLRVTLSKPITLDENILVVLTKQEPIAVTGTDLKAGLEAKLELTFAESGKLGITVPLVDANVRDYATVTPSPEPSPSPAG